MFWTWESRDGWDGATGHSSRRLIEKARIVLTHDGDLSALALLGERPVVGIVPVRPGSRTSSGDHRGRGSVAGARPRFVTSVLGRRAGRPGPPAHVGGARELVETVATVGGNPRVSPSPQPMADSIEKRQPP